MVEGVGLAEPNLTILGELGGALAAQQKPFLFGGDSNVDAGEFAELAWVSDLEEAFLAPDEATINHEFFLDSKVLAPFVQPARAWLDAPRGPRALVEAQLRGLAGRAPVWQKVPIKGFEIPRKDEACVWGDAGGWAPEWSWEPGQPPASLQRAAWERSQGAESFLCLLHSVPELQQAAHCRRHLGSRVQNVPLEVAWAQTLARRVPQRGNVGSASGGSCISRPRPRGAGTWRWHAASQSRLATQLRSCSRPGRSRCRVFWLPSCWSRRRRLPGPSTDSVTAESRWQLPMRGALCLPSHKRRDEAARQPTG